MLQWCHMQVGQHYLAAHWGQRLMTLSSFIDQHLTSAASDNSTDAGVSDEQRSTGWQAVIVHCCAVLHMHQSSRIAVKPPHPAAGQGRGYLAQHELFEQIPLLQADIREPEYCSLGSGVPPRVNAWLGPPGTVRHGEHHNPGQRTRLSHLLQSLCRVAIVTYICVLAAVAGDAAAHGSVPQSAVPGCRTQVRALVPSAGNIAAVPFRLGVHNQLQPGACCVSAL